VLTLLANYRTGTPQPVVVKFASIDTLSMAIIRSLWPNVPCIVVVHDPAEIIVAAMESGIWVRLKARPDLSRQALGWTADGCRAKSFARAMWGD